MWFVLKSQQLHMWIIQLGFNQWIEKQILVTKKINDFFDLEVKGEYARMNAFFKAILGLLEAGISLEVQIKGYTSPRSYEGYNVQLAHRRITSVRKQFFIYENGIFIKFFQKGLLTVTELPLGESTAPKGISDAFNDPKNSIYSVEASKERRAEIVILQRNWVIFCLRNIKPNGNSNKFLMIS